MGVVVAGPHPNYGRGVPRAPLLKFLDITTADRPVSCNVNLERKNNSSAMNIN